jgi:hypothetical protein
MYKSVSSHLLVSKVYRDFNIKYADWEVNAIEWIGDALRLIKAFSALKPCREKKAVSNYRVQLPCDLETLVTIVYQGCRLSPATRVNETCVAMGDCNITVHPSHSYTLMRDGSISTTFESGEVVFHYVAMVVDCDGYPMIPDNQKMIEAIAWYCVRMILLRGYVHPIIKFADANAMWERLYPRAKNSMIMLDRDRREAIHEIWTSMVKESHPADTYFFDNSCATSNEVQTSSADIGYAISFILNVTGVELTVSPDMPVILANATYTIYRSDGTYTYQASKTGYVTQTGTISVLGNNVSQYITLNV